MIQFPEPKRTRATADAQEILDAPDEEKQPKLYVVVSHVTRHFGGPEEGGWWYDIRTNEDVRRVFGTEGVIRVLEKLSDEYPVSRYGRGSVLGDDGDFEFTVCASQEDIPEEQTRRPSYE